MKQRGQAQQKDMTPRTPARQTKWITERWNKTGTPFTSKGKYLYPIPIALPLIQWTLSFLQKHLSRHEAPALLTTVNLWGQLRTSMAGNDSLHCLLLHLRTDEGHVLNNPRAGVFVQHYAMKSVGNSCCSISLLDGLTGPVGVSATSGAGASAGVSSIGTPLVCGAGRRDPSLGGTVTSTSSSAGVGICSTSSS